MQVFSWVVALLLLSAAAALAVIAWRMARGARERESARVELLRSLALPDAVAVPASGPAVSDWTKESSDWATERLVEEVTAPAVDTYEPAPIFSEHAEPVTGLPRWVSLAGVGAAMALGVTIYAVLAGGAEAPSPEAARTTTPATTPAASGAVTTVTVASPAVPDRPIEFIALQSRYGAPTAFEVSGVVRNPADGWAPSRLAAVVNLVDADGRILTSRVMPVERPVLEAGQSSAFSLVFPRVIGTVARYQVGFRLDGRDTIPHVDRRGAEPGAKVPSS